MFNNSNRQGLVPHAPVSSLLEAEPPTHRQLPPSVIVTSQQHLFLQSWCHLLQKWRHQLHADFQVRKTSPTLGKIVKTFLCSNIYFMVVLENSVLKKYNYFPHKKFLYTFFLFKKLFFPQKSPLFPIPVIESRLVLVIVSSWKIIVASWFLLLRHETFNFYVTVQFSCILSEKNNEIKKD